MTINSSIDILIHEEKCTGCLTCQLWCSYTHEKVFNHTKARIQIDNARRLETKIHFLDNCLRCGQCVRYCLYGALEVKR